jgi:hypothetical protein
MTNAIHPGDINRTGVCFLVIDSLSNTNTAVNVGDVCVYDTDGFAPAVALSEAPFAVMVSPSVAAVAATQHPIRVLIRGNVTVNKVAGTALQQGKTATTTATAGSAGSGGNPIGMVTTGALAADLAVSILL